MPEISWTTGPRGITGRLHIHVHGRHITSYDERTATAEGKIGNRLRKQCSAHYSLVLVIVVIRV